MGVRIDTEYRVFVETPYRQHKSAQLDVVEAIKYAAKYLYNLHAIDCLDCGKFVKTTSALRPNETFCKRYVITMNVPYTKITIKKETKGDINREIFMDIISIIKDMYNERI